MAKVTIIALRPFRGDEGFVQPKQRLTVEERRAAELVTRGLATYEVGEKSRLKEEAAAPRNKAVAAAPKNRAAPAAVGVQGAGTSAPAKEGGETAPKVPTDTAPATAVKPARRSGTQAGKAKPRSSSAQGRRPSK